MKERLRLPALAAVLSKPINPFSELVVRQLSTWQKMVYGFAAALLVLLGLLGLVLPVLPGLVFLAMAAGLLARVSPRFGRWWYQTPLVQRFRRKQQQLKQAWPRVWRRSVRGCLTVVLNAARGLFRLIGQLGSWLGIWVGEQARPRLRRWFARR